MQQLPKTTTTNTFHTHSDNPIRKPQSQRHNCRYNADAAN